MSREIHPQKKRYVIFYLVFAGISTALMVYYLSDTLIHFTTPQQFPINSLKRFPLTLLIFPAEVFSFLFSMYFVYNLIRSNRKPEIPLPLNGKDDTRVAIILPVYNEPSEIVERTLKSVKQLRWPGGIRIYLLDDSSTVEDKRNMDALAKRFGCIIVRRDDRIGYKAGNINNGISQRVKEDFFVIFDSDQAPDPSFLEETMDHFSDPEVGFVQTAQYFGNNSTPLERAQQLGTNIFYQSQCISKARDGSMPFCGTNVVVRTEAFRKVNGFSYYTATEDIELGLKINEAGYVGAYVPKVLVEGLSPTHFSAYASQQYRWANGNMAILRDSWHRILFGKFSLRQQMHIFFTSGWWLIGIVTMLYLFVPFLSLFLGGTHHTWLPTWLLGLLLLNVVLGITMIYAALRDRDDTERVRLRDAFLQYSLITNSMFIYARAALNALLGRYVGFVRTSKKREKSGLKNISLNLLLAFICFAVSLATLYGTITSSTIEQVRSFLPISVLMLFYSVVLGSSVLFVGKQPAEQKVRATTEERVEARAELAQ